MRQRREPAKARLEPRGSAWLAVVVLGVVAHDEERLRDRHVEYEGAEFQGVLVFGSYQGDEMSLSALGCPASSPTLL